MRKGIFILDKWYLDLVTEKGEVFICYIAKLKWHGLPIKYTSIISYSSSEGTKVQSRLTNVKFPIKGDDTISWNDNRFNIQGIWKNNVKAIEQKIFESEEGYLKWHCYQPSSDVRIVLKGKEYSGSGYVERLKLTAPPWKIPMDKLRWGRYIGNNTNLVWIQLLSDNSQQWVWKNGLAIDNIRITDALLYSEKKGINLKMDQDAVLESETKILSVVKYLIDHIPGINQIIPTKFLLSKETKWLSKAELFDDNISKSSGIAIHELVTFTDKNEES